MSKPKDQEIMLSKIFLDNDNPRHDPIDNEPEIIASLVRKERVVGLAKDLAKWGLSPLDNIAVKPKVGVPGSYVALEGNRRICALKLLRNPEKAPTAALRKKFSDLADQFGRVPTKISVVVFSDETAARHWLEVRHQGEQGGAGTRKWNAAQKARFSKSANNPNVLSLNVLEYGIAQGLIDPSARDSLALTTLTRYLHSPVVRDALGLASPREFEINVPQDQFDRAVTAFLTDALPRSDGSSPVVNSRTSAKDRQHYANGLRSRGVAATTKLPAATVPKSASNRKAKPRNNPSPDDRPHVVPLDFKVVIRSTILKRLFDELRMIDPELSFATAYLLRAFTEKLAHQFATDNQLSTSGDLHLVIGRCERHLMADSGLLAQAGSSHRLERRLKPLRVMAGEKDSRGSPDTMGSWVHGGMVPSSVELKRFWESMEDCFRLMLDRLKS